MKNYLSKLGALLFAALALHAPAQAQGMPEITPSLKKMLGALPIADMKDDVEKMVGTLKKTSCGGGLTGCYATKTGALQLYFFTSSNAQQTFLLVINQKMALPKLLKENVQKVLGGTSLSDPIISISTTDIDLDITKMPADLQKIVRDSYFNVNSLTFASGVQLAARADLGGVMKVTLQSMGVKTDQLTLRAGVVLPIPTDLAAGAGAGAGLADAMKHSNTMKKAGADALKPEAYVEFQLAPSSVVKMNVPKMTLTDTTFFIDNALTFGYKGNARFDGTSKDILLHFQTPLNPAGAMDLLDFSFRMAMPQSFTLQDQALMSVAMAMPDTGMAASASTTALTKMGGGFIGNINAIKKPLLTVTKPLSVFQLRNPKPAAPYKFGDRTKPFPTTDEPFNVILLGPLADGGPLLYVNSDVRILGQTMGKIEVSVGKAGFHGTVSENISIKLGPLGKTKIKMLAKADVTGEMQDISLKGNLAGQNLLIALAGDTLTIDFSASCVNPFEIKAKVAIQESMDIAQIFDGQGGANVDPSKLQNCVGKDLEAALNKVAGEYKSLSGYTANEASAALNKISSDATAAANKAAKEAKQAADAEAARAKAAADLAYKQAKDAARNLANNSASAVSNVFKDAGNAISGAFGKKKKRSDEHDKFDKTIFNWDYYYDTRGTAWGNTDLVQYWTDHGYGNAERASYEFDLKYFRSQHQGASDKDLLNYWLGTGIDRGDQSSRDFSLKALVSRYPGGSNRDNLEWWFENGGMNSGLNGRP
ncbi:MAG: lectin [Undibacterium sp.]|uniref:lectin n=1 Tax=Undibacterium sp. TaxID=1914977 RepID=UPI0027230F79|nr:lectin [Undibacterium sp.]MDO8651807.1 lectin [Undibacterium sp.]